MTTQKTRIGVPISRMINDVTGLIDLDWTSFFVKLASVPQVYTVATLPTKAKVGDLAYASDCRVYNGTGTREGAGAGTGGLVTYSGSVWRVIGTNVTAAA